MTAVTPVTDEPPTIMLCINRKSAIIPILQTNRDLCINTLSESQQDIAEHFAGLTGLSPEERFAYHIWNRGETGQLEVEGALAHLHGRIVSQHEIGTHFIFYVEINEIKNSGTHPRLYCISDGNSNHWSKGSPSSQRSSETLKFHFQATLNQPPQFRQTAHHFIIQTYPYPP